jgi:hypothetical protein
LTSRHARFRHEGSKDSYCFRPWRLASETMNDARFQASDL